MHILIGYFIYDASINIILNREFLRGNLFLTESADPSIFKIPMLCCFKYWKYAMQSSKCIDIQLKNLLLKAFNVFLKFWKVKVYAHQCLHKCAVSSSFGESNSSFPSENTIALIGSGDRPRFCQNTINQQTTSIQTLLLTFFKFVLHQHNLNSLPSLPIKLKDGVNFQNMFPANSSYTFQRFYSQHKEAKLRLSEFIRNFINSRRCFCSETNHSFTAKVHQQTGLRISDFDKNS